MIEYKRWLYHDYAAEAMKDRDTAPKLIVCMPSARGRPQGRGFTRSHIGGVPFWSCQFRSSERVNVGHSSASVSIFRHNRDSGVPLICLSRRWWKPFLFQPPPSPTRPSESTIRLAKPLPTHRLTIS